MTEFKKKINMYEIEKIIGLARKNPKEARDMISTFELFVDVPITHIVGGLMLCKQNEKCVISMFSKFFKERYLLGNLKKDLPEFIKKIKSQIPLANKAINAYFDYVREQRAKIEDRDASIDKVVLSLINRSRTKNVFRDMERLQVKHIRAMLSKGSYINALYNILEKTYQMSIEGDINAIQAFTYTHDKLQEMLQQEDREVRESDYLKSQLALEAEIIKEREQYQNRLITDEILKNIE